MLLVGVAYTFMRQLKNNFSRRIKGSVILTWESQNGQTLLWLQGCNLALLDATHKRMIGPASASMVHCMCIIIESLLE